MKNLTIDHLRFLRTLVAVFGLFSRSFRDAFKILIIATQKDRNRSFQLAVLQLITTVSLMQEARRILTKQSPTWLDENQVKAKKEVSCAHVAVL